ncbi:AbrB/MazE/SpoVT family DNA-binding domain-containing protein [Synechococcus elongatus]|uniref:AbrB/MazE/SpoVT family DNA-binding domain-containing protein n=1 Tax=Synechococcus elongatus PCC 11802 TaxID=2283154 RepID=A0AAU6R4T3_SYNEL|nr:AbrB/MazE/SpoVT family DNA-binding domain-containing protein [Synechococcus elongatus]QFZ92737.1 AbrB/MazE/SpoVT family DNA-binding domain-containing protein [Synechococcus elongatus PCC 11802]
MRITRKGQVIIPQAVRQQLGLHPHCEVEFRLVGEQLVLEKVDSQRSERAIEAIAHLQAHPPRAGLSTDEILALCRGDA